MMLCCFLNISPTPNTNTTHAFAKMFKINDQYFSLNEIFSPLESELSELKSYFHRFSFLHFRLLSLHYVNMYNFFPSFAIYIYFSIFRTWIYLFYF